MQEFPVSSYGSVPSNPGIYLFLDKAGSVLYVGKAKNLKKRVSSYFSKSLLLPKTEKLVAQIYIIRVIVVESEFESLLLEANYIKKFIPRYNARLTDGKAYPLIRITIKDAYPKILIARRSDDKNSLYFGPYPNSTSMRTVLKIIRRIFPFQSVLNHSKKTCLYYHLGLCPCPPAFESPSFKKEYRKTIKHILNFLDGQTKTVIKNLEAERDELSKKEEFEEAKGIQKKIDSIVYVTSPFHKPFEYETNPNLRDDLRRKELIDLQSHLKNYGTITDFLERIECFDISNIQATNTVGSMVVFTNGEKDSSQYRRFKIHEKITSPNDFAMMAHVVSRRLKHREWEMPNLIIVDGGKGQIGAALNVLQDKNVNIPLMGLAKREEIIITADLKEIRLPRNSTALHLVQRIRDEAHRFAITYHRKLRSKAFLNS